MSDQSPPGVLLHQMSLPVRWSDMDAYGHVNNATYFRYFEIIRMTWFEEISKYPEANTQFANVIVDAHCEYLKPLVFPADITLTMFGGPPGRSSFNSFYQIVNEADQQLYTRGSSRIVWMKPNMEKSTPIPDFVVSMLQEA